MMQVIQGESSFSPGISVFLILFVWLNLAEVVNTFCNLQSENAHLGGSACFFLLMVVHAP